MLSLDFPVFDFAGQTDVSQDLPSMPAGSLLDLGKEFEMAQAQLEASPPFEDIPEKIVPVDFIDFSSMSQAELLAHARQIVAGSQAAQKQFQELCAASKQAEKEALQCAGVTKNGKKGVKRAESSAMRARRLSLMARRLIREWSPEA